MSGSDNDQGQAGSPSTEGAGLSEKQQLTKLLALAHDKSEAGRRILVENISDLFLSGEGRLNDHERALMTDILLKLVQSIEAVVRKALSERLSANENTPRELVMLLANDEIEIARPILEKTRVLRDPDLIEIIKQRTDEHRLVIAMRQAVSRTVSDALVEYGSDDVVETLLKNHDAELSQRALEYLVAESRRVDRFQEPLLSRHDVPPALAHRMFWWVSAALRRRILAQFQVDEIELDNVIEDATRTAIVEHNDTESALARACKLVRRLRENNELTVAFLVQALRQQRLQVFVAGLAELGNMDIYAAWRVFFDKGGESLAILLKAIGVERSDFATIFLLIMQSRDRGSPKSTQILNNIMALFDQITARNARATIRAWQRDPGYETALREVAAEL